MWCVHRQVKMIIHSWLWVLLGVRKSLKKCMKRNGSQPLNLIRKSNNIAEMLRKDCSFSWTIKVKCLFWIVSAPFNFWLRSLKGYGNKFQSLFSEQQQQQSLNKFVDPVWTCWPLLSWDWNSNCTHPGYQPQTYRHGVSSVCWNISGWALEQNDRNMSKEAEKEMFQISIQSQMKKV